MNMNLELNFQINYRIGLELRSALVAMNWGDEQAKPGARLAAKGLYAQGDTR
jgi:hypothetical protein